MARWVHRQPLQRDRHAIRGPAPGVERRRTRSARRGRTVHGAGERPGRAKLPPKAADRYGLAFPMRVAAVKLHNVVKAQPFTRTPTRRLTKYFSYPRRGRRLRTSRCDARSTLP